MIFSLAAAIVLALAGTAAAAPSPQLEQITGLLGGAAPAQLTGLLGGLPGAAPAAGGKKAAGAGGLDLPIDIGAIGNPQALLGGGFAPGQAGTKSSAPVASKNSFANAKKDPVAAAPPAPTTSGIPAR